MSASSSTTIQVHVLRFTVFKLVDILTKKGIITEDEKEEISDYFWEEYIKAVKLHKEWK